LTVRLTKQIYIHPFFKIILVEGHNSYAAI